LYIHNLLVDLEKGLFQPDATNRDYVHRSTIERLAKRNARYVRATVDLELALRVPAPTNATRFEIAARHFCTVFILYLQGEQ
jgi:uncharacterized protein (DUF952 family)